RERNARAPPSWSMWNARARAAARCWATSSSRRARTKPSTFRIRTRPTRPCFIDVLIERLARPPFSQSPNPRPARRAIFAPPVFRSTRSRNRMYNYNRARSTAFEPVRSAMTYESMLAETVAFRGHKGDVGEAYYARPLCGGPWPGVVLIHHMLEKAKLLGSAKGPNGWMRIDTANVYYDHPFHAPLDHALGIDFISEADGGRE